MNDNRMISPLYWLLAHAEQGALREDMTEEDRASAVTFLLASIGESTEESDPKKLAKIVHGQLEGGYHGND